MIFKRIKKINFSNNKYKILSILYLFKIVILYKNGIFKFNKYVKFTKSCLYETNNDNLNINRLFGFTSGLHINNLVMLGWKPNEFNKITIYYIEHLDSIKFPPFKICDIEIDKWYEFEIKFNGIFNQIEYIISDNFITYKVIHPLTIKTIFTIGYMLFFDINKNLKNIENMIIYYI